MTEETSFIVYEGIVVPESVLLRRERKNPYGGVPGLDDEELASPDELEKQVLREEFGPVLRLPRPKQQSFRPEVEEGIVVGAFGSVDFERTRPALDKARYKAAKVRERLKDLAIRIGIVKERLKGKAKYLVLRYLRRGWIREEHIVSEDMLAMVRLEARAKRLRREMVQLEEASRKRRAKALKEWLEA